MDIYIYTIYIYIYIYIYIICIYRFMYIYYISSYNWLTTQRVLNSCRSTMSLCIYLCNHEKNVFSRLWPKTLCQNSCTWTHALAFPYIMFPSAWVATQPKLWKLRCKSYQDNYLLNYFPVYCYYFSSVLIKVTPSFRHKYKHEIWQFEKC